MTRLTVGHRLPPLEPPYRDARTADPRRGQGGGFDADKRGIRILGLQPVPERGR
jgi:hypothetical protein